MNILKESAQHKKSESRIQSVSYRELLFLIDALQVLLLFDVCTAHNIKYKRLRYSQSVSQSLIVNHFLKGFTGLLFIC